MKARKNLVVKAKNDLIEKNRDMGSEKYISTRFRLISNLLRSGRTAKLLMLRWDFRKKGVCCESLSEQVFAKWTHFQISLSMWELLVIR